MDSIPGDECEVNVPYSYACLHSCQERKASSASLKQFMILSAEAEENIWILFGVVIMNTSSVLKLSSILRSSVRQIQSSSSLQDKGFLGGFFERKVETQQKSHSNQFAKKERIIEIHSHSVKPDSIDKYLKNQEVFQGEIVRNTSLVFNVFERIREC